MNEETRNITTCLVDGVESEYDFCSENINAYDKYPVFKTLEYIGAGVIHRINGVKQELNKPRHFWIKKD